MLPTSSFSTNPSPVSTRPARSFSKGCSPGSAGRGAVVVLVTHDLGRGLDLADRLIVLRRGRKVLDRSAEGGRPEELLPFFAAGGSAQA